MGEYAYDFTGENIHDGPSRNPHDITRMTGGSSGGSGGAVGGRPGAAGARLRHQRLDPRAVVAVRHFRAEADLRAADARRNVSVRGEPRSSRPLRALDPRSRARLRRHAGPRRRRPGLRRPSGRADDAAARARADGCASPSPAAISRRAHLPRRSTRSTRVAKALNAVTKSKSPKRRAPAPRPMSSPPPKARRCISIGCASRRAISIPPCATG